MTAKNNTPFVYSRSKDGLPHVFRGLVQAGSSATIKRGEICVFNKTSGYWIAQSAVADFVYAIAIANEEQKSGDSARYMGFYSLHPDDVFEFQLAAARALAVGDSFILTASDSQKLTYSATAFPVARNVDDGHYPETGTTIRNQSYARVTFNPCLTAWGLLINKDSLGKEKVANLTSAVTLLAEQSGMVITNTGCTGAKMHTLPQSCPAGTKFTAICTAACGLGFDPGAAGAIYVKGEKQTDSESISVDDEGDSITVISDGNGDWLGQLSITSAATVSGAITLA